MFTSRPVLELKTI